jgi:hypothetical protein
VASTGLRESSATAPGCRYWRELREIIEKAGDAGQALGDHVHTTWPGQRPAQKRQNVSFRHKNSLQPRQLMRITLFKKE